MRAKAFIDGTLVTFLQIKIGKNFLQDCPLSAMVCIKSKVDANFNYNLGELLKKLHKLH
jgi:hypothetical protein